MDSGEIDIAELERVLASTDEKKAAWFDRWAEECLRALKEAPETDYDSDFV